MALLDTYDLNRDAEDLALARSTCDFLLRDLRRTEKNGTFCFSYSPLDSSVVYNASMLGARLLARVYHYTRERELRREAQRAVRFALDVQNEDGSWFYGALPMQQWIDSYHTGYKVEALHDYANYCGDYDVLPNLRRAVHFYRKEFFSENGTPKFYPRSMYPIDIHAPAQGIVTLVRACADLPLAKKVARWTIRHMQDQQGFFYYKKTRFYTIRVPYMRWSQAWMLYGLSWLLGDSGR